MLSKLTTKFYSNDKKVLKSLKKFRFSEAEARIYVELLKNGTTTASELAKLSGYSRTKVYRFIK